MPINPMYVQPLSFQQANPVLMGAQMGSNLVGDAFTNQLKNLQAQQLGIQNQVLPQSLQAQLQKLQLGNQNQQITNQYLPQTLQSNIGLSNAQAGSADAQANYLGAETKFLPFQALGNLDPVTKMIYSRVLAQRLTGNGQNPPLASGNGGMTVQPAAGGQVSSTPPMMNGVNYTEQAPSAGNYQTLPGGLNPAQGQQVLQQLNSAPQPAQNSGMGMPGMAAMPDVNNLYDIQMRNLMTQMGKDPSMGSNRAGAGGTYINPYTGQTTTTDTNANTTMDQRTSAAIQRVTPMLNDLATNLSPFQTASGDAALRTGQVWNYFGGHASAPDQYALGQSLLKTAPESLLRSFSLPATNESLERMSDAIEPRFGETSDGYKNRITKYLTGELIKYQSQSNARLKSGMDVDQGDPDAQASAQGQAADPLGIR